MHTLYICRTLNVMMYVCALKNCELKKVLNITYNSFAISVMSSFNTSAHKVNNNSIYKKLIFRLDFYRVISVFFELNLTLYLV